jgi:ribosome maturation factor RimP
MAHKSEWLQVLEQAVESFLATHGYELVFAEFVERGGVLRLYIDREGGVTLDDCTKVSRLIGDMFDAEDIVKTERYTLEVSSPGLDRPLVKPSHYQRFVGRDIQVKTRKHQEGGRMKFKGELQKADETQISLSVDGKEFRFAYNEIDIAKLIPEF